MIEFGLDQVCHSAHEWLDSHPFSLLCNRASVDASYHFSGSVLANRYPNRLVSLLSPQHGLWSEQQANMIESGDDWHDELSTPIFSLYSDTRSPKEAMVEGAELLVIDLQDVGTRVYTFIWTVMNCLEFCAQRSIKVLVLDRPNPIGGSTIEGPRLDTSFRSFVGQLDIPMRHGLTIGEMSQFANHSLESPCELKVVPVRNWDRQKVWQETGRQWIEPSPNLPTLESVSCYPGQVLLEGTNLSEGRGTTQPFQLTGAPWLVSPRSSDNHSNRLTRVLKHASQSVDSAECIARETRFLPTFDKYANQTCHGIRWHSLRQGHSHFAATVHTLAAIAIEYPDQFEWLPPPYEYETQRQPIDILFGNDDLRELIDAQSTAGTASNRELQQLCFVDTENWFRSAETSLIYQ